MFFRGVGQKWCKFRVTIEHANALNDIPVIKFILLTRNCNFLPGKPRKSIWELFVDDAVEFLCTRKRKAEVFDNLGGGYCIFNPPITVNLHRQFSTVLIMLLNLGHAI